MTDDYNSLKDTAESLDAARKAIRMEKIKSGEIIPWKRKEVIGDQVLFLGDCLEVMAALEPVDAVVSDPPYGMDWNTDFTRFTGGNVRRGGGTKHKKILNDASEFNPLPFICAKECILFGANHFWSRLPDGGALVWIKRNDGALNTFLSDGEIAFLKNRKGVFAYREVIAGSKKAVEAGLDPYGPSAHPTQKPIGLMIWALGFVRSETILDPFMGSGTTLVACAKMGRKGIGIELDPDYFEIACRRVQEAYRQPDFFVSQPKEPEAVQVSIFDGEAAE